MIAAADDNAGKDRAAKRRKGYVLVYRSLIDSPLFDDAGLFRLFMYLILRAAHKPQQVTIRTGRGTKTIEIDVAQVLVGMPSLAKKMRTPKTTIRRWLNRLKADRQIDIKADSHYSVVTVCNWSTYQNAKSKDGQASGAKSGAASGQATGQATGPIQDITNKALSKNPSSPKLRFATEDREFAEWMLAKIRNLQPAFKAPNLEAWANEIRLTRERDGRTIDELRSVFTWANADSFWQGNVLSPSKLREKFDALKIKIERTTKIPQPVLAESKYAGPGSDEWNKWRPEG